MGLEAINKMGRAVKNNCSGSTIVLEPVLNEQTTSGHVQPTEFVSKRLESIIQV